MRSSGGTKASFKNAAATVWTPAPISTRKVYSWNSFDRTSWAGPICWSTLTAMAGQTPPHGVPRARTTTVYVPGESMRT